MKVLIKNILKIRNKDFYILEDKFNNKKYVKSKGRKLYTLEIQESNRRELTMIEFLTDKSLLVGDYIKI